MKNIEVLIHWIAERECIRERRAAGEPPPWSDDEIFIEWSFCNVKREADATTVWITKNWREPHATDFDLWFALTVARFVNWPDTLAEIGYPVPWDPKHFLAVMSERRAKGAKLYNNAYMIRADNRPAGERYAITAEYQAAEVFGPLWRDRKELRPRKGETLASYHRRLGAYHGMGDGFMPAQVVADLKYASPLRSAADWSTFAVSGPGSRRGLNLVLGRPIAAVWTEGAWRREFDRLRAAIAPDLDRLGLGDLHAQDL